MPLSLHAISTEFKTIIFYPILELQKKTLTFFTLFYILLISFNFFDIDILVITWLLINRKGTRRRPDFRGMAFVRLCQEAAI